MAKIFIVTKYILFLIKLNDSMGSIELEREDSTMTKRRR